MKTYYKNKLYILVLIFLVGLSCLKAKKSPLDITTLTGAAGGFAISFEKNNSSTYLGNTITLQFTSSAFVFTKGLQITSIVPTITGTVTSCTASSTLPTGLVFNNTTCGISGTPTELQPATNYTITASNGYGTTTATISITVIDSAITGIKFNGNPYSLGRGKIIRTITPTFSGGATTSCTISPTLPAGLSIDSTCAISGTPTAPLEASKDYTITATNSAGSLTTTISIAIAMPLQVADTGQTQCTYYTSGSWSLDNTCMQTYNVGNSNYPFGQDANYIDTPIARSFSYPTATGSDYTTTDNVTGLVWKTCSEGQSWGSITCVNSLASYDWNGAISACNALNTANSGAGYANRKDWHLPTIRELRTIMDYGNGGPFISNTYFPGISGITASWVYYWSSSEYRTTSTSTQVLDFKNGYAESIAPKTDISNNVDTYYYTRCVAGNIAYTQSLTDKGDGTILDNHTGLVWQKCSMGRNNDATCSDDSAVADTAIWVDGLTYCENLTLGNSSDWRLPNKNELNSIIDNTIISSFPIDPLFVSSNQTYWSSTSYINISPPVSAMGTCFGPCYFVNDKSLFSRAVRCVR